MNCQDIEKEPKQSEIKKPQILNVGELVTQILEIVKS